MPDRRQTRSQDGMPRPRQNRFGPTKASFSRPNSDLQSGVRRSEFIPTHRRNSFRQMDAATDKDLPLKEDTRLLGRVLGDVLRAQTGEEGFARIESIRQTAVKLRRAAPGEAAAHVKDELAALLNPLPIAHVLEVSRAFSYFSHLANLAEDVHQTRRRRAHALA